MIFAKEIRQFESYAEMSAVHQKDVDNFPMCFIFGRKSDEDIREELYKSLGTRDLNDVMKSPYGGIILKKDLSAMIEMFKHHDRERDYFNRSFDKLVESIKSEMYNHEYSYTLDPMDTLMALGKTTKAFQDYRFKKAFETAEKQVLREAA